MVTRWVPDTAGEAALMAGLAAGASAFAEHVRNRTREIEKGLERYHFHSPTVPSNVRYADTIQQATYLNGELIGGRDVRGVGNVARTPLRSVIYSTSFLASMLEVTGASPHDIEIPVHGLPTRGSFTVTIHHPGFSRRPHFVPGLFSSANELGAKMSGKMIQGRSESARLAGRLR